MLKNTHDKHIKISNKTWNILKFLFIIWVGFTILNFMVPVTAVLSQKTDISFNGIIANSEPITGGSRFDLVTPNGNIIMNNTIPILVNDGEKLLLERNYDFVVFPFIYDPNVKIWDEIYINNVLEYSLNDKSPKSYKPLYIPSVLLGGTITMMAYSFLNGAKNNKNGEDN